MPAGPLLRGKWRGNVLGSGSDAWKYWDEKRAGNITEKDWEEIEGGISRSFGTCMVMGTAATMMAITEALGLALPGASSIPAVDSSHTRMCAAAGRRIVDMVWDDLTPTRILTPAAFDNAIRVHMAMGGSTNAIIHLVAMARRAGIALDMKRFDDISREIPGQHRGCAFRIKRVIQGMDDIRQMYLAAGDRLAKRAARNGDAG